MATLRELRSCELLRTNLRSVPGYICRTLKSSFENAPARKDAVHTVLQLTGKLGRWFRKWPHWAKDLYGIISYVNFVELLPTVAAIILAPRHFFRRLSLVLADKRRMYQTPVKFFVNFASLFLAVFYLRHGDLSGALQQATAVWYMPLLIPLTPVLMAGLAIVCWCLYQLPRLVPSETRFPHPNPYPLLLVLSPVAYWHLDPRRFAWGLFYMSVYFVAAWQLAQVIIGADFLATVALVQQLGDGHLVVKAVVLIMAIVLATSIVHWLVFRPYGEMFRTSLRRPTRTVFEADVYDIENEVSEFLARAEHGDLTSDEFAALGEILAEQLAIVSKTCRVQDHDCRLTEQAQQQRARIYARGFQQAELRRTVATAVNLPDDLIRRYETLWAAMQDLAQVPAASRLAA